MYLHMVYRHASGLSLDVHGEYSPGKGIALQEVWPIPPAPGMLPDIAAVLDAEVVGAITREMTADAVERTEVRHG